MEKGRKSYGSKSTGKYLTGLKIKQKRGIVRIKYINGRENKREWDNEDTLGSYLFTLLE